MAPSCPRARFAASLADTRHPSDVQIMWDEPYLETCCRSALHRLVLAGESGRPAAANDRSCLRRLAGLGLTVERKEGDYAATPQGLARHAQEVLRRPSR